MKFHTTARCLCCTHISTRSAMRSTNPAYRFIFRKMSLSLVHSANRLSLALDAKCKNFCFLVRAQELSLFIRSSRP